MAKKQQKTKKNSTVKRGKLSNKKCSSKLNKKAKIRIFLFFIIFGSVTIYLSYNFFSNVSMIIKINEEKLVLQEKLISLQDEEEELNSDIKKLEDPEYVARYAREKYMYSKDGELIIRIPDDE